MKFKAIATGRDANCCNKDASTLLQQKVTMECHHHKALYSLGLHVFRPVPGGGGVGPVALPPQLHKGPPFRVLIPVGLFVVFRGSIVGLLIPDLLEVLH